MHQSDSFFRHLLQECQAPELERRMEALDDLRRHYYVERLEMQFLLDRLNCSSEENEQHRLLSLMRETGKPLPVEALMTILADWETSSLFLRMSVAHALWGVEEAFELSLQLLQDPEEHPWLREVLAGDLIVWRERLPADFVLTLLDDPTVTSAVVEALGDWPPETIPVDRLIPFCTHERKYLREVTIKTLTKAEQRAPIAPILAALHDPEPEVRAAASHACMELVKLHPDQIPPDLMLQALSDEYAAVREDALDTLAQMPLRVPVEPVIASLSDPISYVRCAAAEMLGIMGERVPSSVYPILRQMSGADESAHVRQRATRSLLLLSGMNPPPLRLPSIDLTLEELERWNNPEEWQK